jgi:hypothetical protein
VAAGSAVDIVVSLGDRHYEIPVYLCATSNVNVQPSAKFDWIWPDGTVQNGTTCTYVPPKGEGLKKVLIRMKAGFTVADITAILYGAYANSIIYAEDLVHLRPSVYIFQLESLVGDIANLKDAVGSPLTGIYLNGGTAGASYGSIADWVAIKAGQIWFYSASKYFGSVKFQAGATTNSVVFLNAVSFSYEDIAATIVNWDNCNAASFARTGNFNQYKRSLIGAANPAAEAAIVSLIAKGCAFTFLAE